MKKIFAIVLTITVILSGFAGCGSETESEISTTILSNAEVNYSDAQVINLDGDKGTINGKAIEAFDYTWHCDPSVSHYDVKNAPAEYYTGEKPQTDAAIYIDHELYYYPLLDESKFKLQNYDGENEWTYYYTDGKHDEYIFATLPALGNSLPTQMMHSEEEAAKNQVLHITKAGTYSLSGNWNGQIMIDLGDEDETFANPEAKVTVILNGIDINCTVAPGIIFRNAYECDNTWEERKEYSSEVDISDAGVNVVIADGTENNISGTNIYRMLKTVYKDENSNDKVKVQKKMRKVDAAFYSYVSMNISGNGTLNITSGFEGLDSELHLTVNGGNITVNSQDDGINVNEDNVSVITVNDGNITINAANGAEGDGIDSNGFIAINGGIININGVTAPDSAMDSEDGIYYNAGKVIIDGKEQTYNAGLVFRETGGMGGGMPNGNDFGNKPPAMQEVNNFDIDEFKQAVAELDNDATVEDVLELLGMDFFRDRKPDDENRPMGDMPQPPEKPNN